MTRKLWTKKALWDQVVDQEQRRIDAYHRITELESQLTYERARADQAEAVIADLAPERRDPA